MTYPEKDVEELVQAALEYIGDGSGKRPKNNGDWLRFKNAGDKFRPKPRVGTLVVKTPDPVFPNATTVINDGGIELTDEVRKACAEAGIKWEETT